MIKVIITILAVMVTVFILLYLFPPIKVEGDSMYPTFKEGEILIGCRLFNRKKCKIGKIYVIHLRNEENGEPYYIIKRLERRVLDIYSADPCYKYFFLGDNREVSADSRIYGLFESSKVVAVIIGKKGRR